MPYSQHFHIIFNQFNQSQRISMKVLFYASLFLLTQLLYANSSFAPSSECKTCHPTIYKEFTSSMHQNATIYKDPIHKAVWDKHPINTKKQKYVCGKCHTPAADNLSDMLSKGTQGMPDPNNATHNEAVSCAYCHRIESIKPMGQSNTNVISQKEKHYFGTLKDTVQSSYHTTSSDNQNFNNGNVCIGCHSHKQNKAKLNVCSTNNENELDGANCVSCHMPKVAGSVSNKHERKEHAFHGFPGAHSHQDMLAQYIDLELLKNIDNFDVAVNNKSSHALLLHPLRVAQLRVVIERDGKKEKLKTEVFVRVIGKDGKPTPPWIANSIVKDTMIKHNEKRVVRYDRKLEKGDKVHMTLGYFLVKPKAAKKFGLDKDPVASKFYTLKSKTITIK